MFNRALFNRSYFNRSTSTTEDADDILLDYKFEESITAKPNVSAVMPCSMVFTDEIYSLADLAGGIFPTVNAQEVADGCARMSMEFPETLAGIVFVDFFGNVSTAIYLSATDGEAVAVFSVSASAETRSRRGINELLRIREPKRKETLLEVYDLQMRRVAILENASDIDEDESLNAVGSLKFTLPADDPKNDFCNSMRFVDCAGRKYRILTPVEADGDEDTITYECEHVIATLCDDVLFGSHVVGNVGYYTPAVINYILSKQETKRWVLDECDYKRQFEYGWENENLLASLFSVPNRFTTPYKWCYDTTSYPWKLSLKAIDTEAEAQLYLMAGKNLLSSEKTPDASNICTRLYCLGYGEGVNQLTIAEANGGKPYIDAPQEYIDRYGLITRIFVDRRYETAQSLMERGIAILNEMREPVLSYTCDAVELYDLTHDERDKIEVGGIVVLAKDNYKTYIVSKSTNRDTDSITITIANKTTDVATSIAEIADRQRAEQVYSQGATQLYAQSIQANATTKNPAQLNFYLPAEMKIINKVQVKIALAPFRSYSQATGGGGSTSVTSSSGGGTTATSSAGGGINTSSSAGGGTTVSASSGGGTTATSSSGGGINTTSSAGGSTTVASADGGSTSLTSASNEGHTATSSSGGGKTVTSTSTETTTATSSSGGSKSVTSTSTTTSTITSSSGGGTTVASADGGGKSVTSSSGGSKTVTSASTKTSTATSSSGGGTSATSSSGGGTTATSSSGGGDTVTSGSAGYTYTSSGSGGSIYQSSGTTTLSASNVMSYDNGGYGNSNHNHGIARGTWLAVGLGATQTVQWCPSGAHDHAAHSHTISVSSHTHTISISSHTHSVKIANHTHTVKVSNHTHTVEIANHTHTVSIPGHSHTVDVPAHTHTVDVPDHTHSVKIPDHTHTVRVQGHSHTVTTPNHTHTVEIPGHAHNVTIANHSHTVTIPSHTHKVDIPDHTHNVKIPSHTHTVTATAHTHTVKIEAHTHTVKLENHEHTVKVDPHTHNITIPNHEHKITIPAHTHAITQGIFTFGSPQRANIAVNGTTVIAMDGTSGEYDITRYLLNENGKINRGAWQSVSVLPNDLAYVTVDLFVQGFIQSEGGSVY